MSMSLNGLRQITIYLLTVQADNAETDIDNADSMPSATPTPDIEEPDDVAVIAPLEEVDTDTNTNTDTDTDTDVGMGTDTDLDTDNESVSKPHIDLTDKHLAM